jgi:hypothetical protein
MTPNDSEGREDQELPIHGWWECKMVQPLSKTSWQFPIKLNIILPYDPATGILDLKTYVHTKTSTWMFISALSLIGKT